MSAKEFFKEKVFKPIQNQLSQGADPKSLAKSAALGSVMSIIPVFSVSTWLCIVIAAKWKLNQVVVQVFNYVFYPFQFILIPVFISLGAKLTGSPPVSFQVNAVIGQFKVSPSSVFTEYGVAWAKGVIVWALVSPLVFIVIYQISFFAFSRFIQKRKEGPNTPATADDSRLN